MVKSGKVSRRNFLVGSGGLVGTAVLSAGIPKRTLAQAGPAVARKVKIQWIEWITPEISDETVRGMLDAFNRTNAGKNIEIERLTVPYGQAYDKILTLQLAGKAPDVIQVNAPWVAVLNYQGILTPLDHYFRNAGEQWTSNLAKCMLPLKGVNYVVPLTVNPAGLYYNEQKLEDAGFSVPPKTWAEVESMGPKLTNPAKNTYAYTSGMAAQSPYDGPEKEILPLIYQCNDTVFKDGKCNLNSPAAVTALKWWFHLVNDLKIYAPGVFTNRAQDKNEQFVGEVVAFNYESPTHIVVAQRRNPKLRFGVAQLPAGKTYGNRISLDTMGIGQTSKSKDAAWEFLHWLGGLEGNRLYALGRKQLAANTKADVSEMYADRRVKAFADIFAAGRCFIEMHVMPETINAYRILVEQIHEIANKRKTVEEALEFATTEWNKILAKYA